MTRSFLFVLFVISPVSSARIPFDYPTEVPNSSDDDSDYGHIEHGIVNGEQTSVEKYPFLAYLRYGGYQCTGSYIASNMIITAEHCVTNYPNREKIRGRATVGTSKKDILRMVNYNPENIHLYPSGGSGVLDIAIIVLDDKPLKKLLKNTSRNFEKFGTVRLAKNRRVEMGDWLTAAGWGITSNSDPYSSPEYPGETQLEVVNCAEYFGCGLLRGFTQDRAAYFWAIGTQVPGSGTCSGDSGGPILCDDGTLCGITHIGPIDDMQQNLCGVQPAVFVDLTRPAVQSWIRNMLEKYGHWF